VLWIPKWIAIGLPSSILVQEHLYNQSLESYKAKIPPSALGLIIPDVPGSVSVVARLSL
jgi:hypothetical protein